MHNFAAFSIFVNLPMGILPIPTLLVLIHFGWKIKAGQTPQRILFGHFVDPNSDLTFPYHVQERISHKLMFVQRDLFLSLATSLQRHFWTSIGLLWYFNITSKTCCSKKIMSQNKKIGEIRPRWKQAQSNLTAAGCSFLKSIFLKKQIVLVKSNIYSVILTAAHCLLDMATCRLVVSIPYLQPPWYPGSPGWDPGYIGFMVASLLRRVY